MFYRFFYNTVFSFLGYTYPFTCRETWSSSLQLYTSVRLLHVVFGDVASGSAAQTTPRVIPEHLTQNEFDYCVLRKVHSLVNREASTAFFFSESPVGQRYARPQSILDFWRNFFAFWNNLTLILPHLSRLFTWLLLQLNRYPTSILSLPLDLYTYNVTYYCNVTLLQRDILLQRDVTYYYIYHTFLRISQFTKFQHETILSRQMKALTRYYC